MASCSATDGGRGGSDPAAGSMDSRFRMLPPDPSLPVRFMDELATPDPSADPQLQDSLLPFVVHSVSAGRGAARAEGAAQAVTTVTESGVYTAVLEVSPDADLPSEFLPESIEPRGISNGVDSRVNVAPPNGVGQIGTPAGVCSAALIGLRVLRTAAHCIVKHTTGGGTVPSNGSVTFRYKRNGSTVPVTATSQQVWFGGGYLSGNCARAKDLNSDGDIKDAGEDAWGYGQNVTACSNEDWALVMLPDSWWGSYGAATFGYRMPSTSDVGLLLEAGGYPVCDVGLPDSPWPCEPNEYFRDRSSACKLNAYVSTAPDLRLWKSGCDASDGQSGGPAWDRSAGWYLGHFQWSECSNGTACAITTPNHFLGHNQWLYDFQGTVRTNSGRP